MKSYRVKAKTKQKAEVNVARILQAIDPATAQETEIKQVVEVDPRTILDAPRGIEAMVSSRKRTHEEATVPPYEMRCVAKSGKSLKSYRWRGQSEDSSKFAVAYLDGNELKLSLVDHWYKFSRINDSTVVSSPDLPQPQTTTEKMNIDEEVFGEDSEDEPCEKKPKRSRKQVAAEDENDSGKEEMDFTEEFDDDDEEAEDQEVEEPTVSVTATKLTQSGKDIEKALNVADDFSSSSTPANSEDALGLDDSSEESVEASKVALKQENFIQEMIRLGKVSKVMLQEQMNSKFNLKDKEVQGKLAGFIKKLTDELREGTEVFYVLKEEFKRTMPQHAARVQFQTGRR